MILATATQGLLEVGLTSHACNESPWLGTNCPRCGTDMDVHQPDSNMPDRLLHTCPECSQWTIVEFEADSHAWQLEIPSLAEARETALVPSGRAQASRR